MDFFVGRQFCVIIPALQVTATFGTDRVGERIQQQINATIQLEVRTNIPFIRRDRTSNPWSNQITTAGTSELGGGRRAGVWIAILPSCTVHVGSRCAALSALICRKYPKRSAEHKRAVKVERLGDCLPGDKMLPSNFHPPLVLK
ncbi:hypothetical protein EDB85DRAFT_304152 [Lactarius pseudohatsudake]|nr:hypothetical protein EDB85DRAFT_304152 [Lactarius pseudohatsudake]